MKIKSLKLINYRCFKEFEIDLQDSFTLLVGNNGSGKSTVLDGLAVGLASFFLGMNGASSGSIHPNDVRVESFALAAELSAKHNILLGSNVRERYMVRRWNGLVP